jgi:hypothetical protein
VPELGSLGSVRGALSNGRPYRERREMDTGGKVYISVPGLSGARALDEVSAPVKAVAANYDLLTKRIRFFTSPRIAMVFPRERREGERSAIYKLISGALEETSKPSQVA